MHIPSKMKKALLLSSLALLGLNACGGGGGGGGGNTGAGDDGSNNSTNDTVSQVLNDLNVPTTQSNRVDPHGNPLPEDYAPFGTRVIANKFSEILLFGVPIDDAAVSTSNNEMAISNLVPGANNSFRWELLHDETVANTPWTDNTAKRSSATADFDNDGLEEIAVLYQLDGDVELVIIDDATENYRIHSASTVDNNTVDEIFIRAGDYDGDSDIDIVAGFISTTGDSELKMLANTSGVLAYNGLSISIPKRSLTIAELVIKSGNLDYDAGWELAVAVNAGNINNTSTSIATTESWYSIYDDANNSFATLRSDSYLELATDRGATRAAITNIDIADIDGDSVDEVVLAGLNQSGNLREGYSNFHYLIEVLDDKTQNFRLRLSGFEDILTSADGNYQPQSSGANQQLNHVALISADVDGDGAKEFLVGQHLFQSLASSPASLAYYDDQNDATDDAAAAKIPAANWFGEATSGMRFNFQWNSYSVAAGDVTLDGRENIVIYAQPKASIIGEEQQLQVWGHDQVSGWRKIADYANVRSVNTPYNPQLHLPDIELDDDTAMLSYSSGSHELVFTEPVILAAIAAAPCATNLGQDLSTACRSAYGTAVSDSSTKTDGTTFSGRASVGGGVDGGPTPNSIEMSLSLEKRARSWTSASYTLTKTLLYETGANEDSVVFASVPLDLYTYTVLSHPDPTLVGTEVVVRLPREAITVMVTRDKYNESVLEDWQKIDGRIFQHTEGDPSSYPSPAEKSALLNRYLGVEGTATSVGEGSGRTVSTISSFDETASGKDRSWEGSFNFRTTAGLLGGYGLVELSVGYGKDTSIETAHGSESIFQGAVGNIDEASFDAGLGYNWGIFSYTYNGNPGQQPFEVINYWVD